MITILHNNGDIVLVKGLFHIGHDGKLIRDPHGSKGRPCLIISDFDEKYHVCPFQSQVIHKNYCFLVDPSMIYVYKNKLFYNRPGTIRMDWNHMGHLSIYDDFKKIAKMNSKPYLKFLQSFLKYHNMKYQNYPKQMILEDAEFQINRLTLKHKIPIIAKNKSDF